MVDLAFWMTYSWPSCLLVVFFIGGQYLVIAMAGIDFFVIWQNFIHLALYFFKPEKVVFVVGTRGDAELALF